MTLAEVPAVVNLLDPAFQQCPHQTMAVLRAHDPVHHVESMNLWLVTTHDLVREALARPDLYSSRFGTPVTPPPPSVAGRVAEIRAQGWPDMPTLLTEDPPVHQHQRRLVSRAFTARHVAGLEPWLDAQVNALISKALSAPKFDFVAEFAAPFPLAVIAHMLDVAPARLPDFRRWSDEITTTIGTTRSDEDFVRGAELVVQFQRYFDAELERRRHDPQADLLSRLANAHTLVDGGTEIIEPLSTAACLNIIQQLLVAGNETSTKMLTGAVALLGEHPRWWRWLKEAPEQRAPAVVEETLRHLSPVQGMFRVTTRKTTLGGVELPAGAMVLLSFASANRDESAFGDPDTFDPLRSDGRTHLAFGHGIHSCIGASLARLEGRVALTNIAKRVSAIEIMEPHPQYAPSFLLRGLQRLTVSMVGEPVHH